MTDDVPPLNEAPAPAVASTPNATARKALVRLNALAAAAHHKTHRTEELMQQLGAVRRTNQLLLRLLVVMAAWVSLATAAVVSFVTPESFDAWREGIAIQLIRRAPQTNIMGLHARRIFGYFVERLFFEVPGAVLSACRAPILVVQGLLLALPTAAVVRAASPWECDVLLSGLLVLLAQLLFLGDDLAFQCAPLLARVGGFVIMVAAGVITLPAVLRKFHKPTPWSRYRAAILRQLRATAADDDAAAAAGSGGAAAGAATAAAPAPTGPQHGLGRRLWLRFVQSQRRRRHTATSTEVAWLLLANLAVWMVDTMIAHD